MKDIKVCNVFNAIYINPVNTKHKRVYVMYEATVCTHWWGDAIVATFFNPK